jgi:hypothetical protein
VAPVDAAISQHDTLCEFEGSGAQILGDLRVFQNAPAFFLRKELFRKGTGDGS